MAEEIIRGMPDLLKSLNAFPKNIQKNVMRGAVRAAASAIAKDAKKNVPTDENILKKSIGISPKRERSKSLIRFVVSPRKDLLVKGFKASGLEKKHYVSKKTGFHYTNYDNYGGYVEFGTSTKPAHPYLRPAYELKGEEAIKIVKEYIAKRLDKEIQKAKKWLKLI